VHLQLVLDGVGNDGVVHAGVLVVEGHVVDEGVGIVFLEIAFVTVIILTRNRLSFMQPVAAASTRKESRSVVIFIRLGGITMACIDMM
jgi:hypothetical protein